MGRITLSHLGLRWGNLPLRTKGMVVLLLPLVALLLNTLSIFVVGSEQQKAQSGVVHTLKVRMLVEQVVRDISLAGSSSRSYKLTRNPNDLEDHRGAATRLSTTINALQAQTADNPAQQKRIPNLRQAIQ